ncbi:4-hydroxyphenylacetate 3-monooxygenase reductase component [Neomoorella glycerini]|uniref:4-hydroxyphenylacetate 3-monooxygenase reductase component n=1 Tax=Neomoorella glycerini TaxID=55779 RepID=A0A6I5ZNK8_9FIRM|nr:flavin reductase family protein [Moorella glycerini]QGP91453.1 4-hydroxyphenylacetate 3-monooxygenase reductase component [Moorella glycerini]
MSNVEITRALGKIACPCGLVGVKKGEKHDLTTVAWFTQQSSNPPQVMVSLHPHRYVLELLDAAGEFVLSILADDQEDIAAFCGTHSGRDVDKIKELGLATEPAAMVTTPRVKDALANLECRVSGRYQKGDHVIIVGQVVAANVSNDKKPLLYYEHNIAHWDQ